MKIIPLTSRNTKITTHPRFNPISLTIFILFIIPLITLTACNNTAKTTSINPASPTSPLARVNADYQQGRYSSAYQNAGTIYNDHHNNSPIRDQAAYFAGLSAYHLNKYNEADRYLQPLRTNSDRTIAGNASATLGLIAREQNHPAEAILLFKAAYQKLTAQDRAEAAYQTGLAYRELNQTAQARQQFLLARAASRDSQFRSQVDQYIQDTGWTVQLGAFSSITNAQKRLNEYNHMNASHSLGQARILQQSNSATHTTLYLVQVGNFMDYNLAAQARSKITGPAVITTIHPKS